jgi:hypothetical protein
MPSTTGITNSLTTSIISFRKICLETAFSQVTSGRDLQGVNEIISPPYYVGIAESKARVSATTRLVNFGSRTSTEPSIGPPLSS